MRGDVGKIRAEVAERRLCHVVDVRRYEHVFPSEHGIGADLLLHVGKLPAHVADDEPPRGIAPEILRGAVDGLPVRVDLLQIRGSQQLGHESLRERG